MQPANNALIEGCATEADAAYLRRAIAMASESRAGGNRPFAAMVVLGDEVLAESQTIRPRAGDATGHSELRVLSAVSSLHRPPALVHATLYASAEPCAMCAGAAYWSGVGRVVFGLSERRLREFTGDHPDNPTLDLPCRELFARGQRRIEVIGPHLENEAVVPHQGYWQQH